VQRAQKKIAKTAEYLSEEKKREDRFEAGIGRVFHRKSNGCVVGKLNLIDNRPLDPQGLTAVGMFDPNKTKSYDVVMRFSNGVGFEQSDKLPDVRGAAIKVFDVYNPSTGKFQTVDLLMTNSPTPFGKDFLEFADFMDLVADLGSTLGGAAFATHPKAALSLFKTTGLPVVSNYKVKSVATIRYWSGHPYLLGPDLAMKFNIIPTQTDEPTKKVLKTELSLSSDYYPSSGDYLRHDLKKRLEHGPVKFTFAVQLEKNSKDTPIEDNLTEWKEKNSQSIPVAELVLEQQYLSTLENEPSSCEKLRFTPGHYIPEHRPLSNMGRGRIFGYEASQIGRNANAEEPDADFLSKFRADVDLSQFAE
jgi:catalase